MTLAPAGVERATPLGDGAGIANVNSGAARRPINEDDGEFNGDDGSGCCCNGNDGDDYDVVVIISSISLVLL